MVSGGTTGEEGEQLAAPLTSATLLHKTPEFKSETVTVPVKEGGFTAPAGGAKVNGWVLCCADITRTTACRPTSRRSTCSGRRLRTAGSSRFGDEASAAASTGRGWIGSRNSGFLVPALFILGRSSALLSGPEIRAQCGSSARGDLCGGRWAQSRVNRPYRDRFKRTEL